MSIKQPTSRVTWVARTLGAVALASLAIGTSVSASPSMAETTITGAGATFPYPLYSKWASAYYKENNVKLNYQSIGSGGGIAQIKAKTVDFGASDAPLKPEELDEAGLLQFPAAMGGVVPVVNLPGIKTNEIKLTEETLADIYLGKITKWNDPAIAANNSGVDLPSTAITVVHRADGSGTTWIFTNYLTKVSKDWSDKVGNGKAVDWPVGVGGKGNEGVAAYVQRIKGSIGYVEYAYALSNNMTTTQLRNHSKQFVAPTSQTFQAAAANADWATAPGFYMVLTDQPGAESWPITGATFILVYKNQDDAEHIREVLEFWDWCYRYGDEMAEKLHYVPMPDSVVKLVEDKWSKEITVAGKSAWAN